MISSKTPLSDKIRVVSSKTPLSDKKILHTIAEPFRILMIAADSTRDEYEMNTSSREMKFCICLIVISEDHSRTQNKNIRQL